MILRVVAPVVFKSFKRVGCLLGPDKLEFAGFPLARPKDNPYKASRANPCPLPIPPLQLQVCGTTITLANNPIWRYLGFFFDTFLTFKYHVSFYANKALSTVRALPVLGNSKCGLPPHAKRLIYISNARPLMLYGHMVWYNPRHPQKTLIKSLARAQAAASRWITGGFRTSP